MNPSPLPILVLVAHGSQHRPQAVTFLHDLAQAIADRRCFHSVVPLVMRGQPAIGGFADVVAQTSPGTDIIVVPLFMARGHYTDRLVPKALGLCKGDGIRYTPPLGCHPRMAQYLQNMATGLCPTPPGATRLLLVAHGSTRPHLAGNTAQDLADAMNRTARFAHVDVVYLEQPPLAKDWGRLAPSGHVLVLPLLLANGIHRSRDIPDLFHNDDPQRHVTVLPGIDVTPDLIDMVLDLAAPHAPMDAAP